MYYSITKHSESQFSYNIGPMIMEPDQQDMLELYDWKFTLCYCMPPSTHFKVNPLSMHHLLLQMLLSNLQLHYIEGQTFFGILD